MNYVIGSGPAGISAAVALVNAGQPVTIIDGGINLEPERRALIDTLQKSNRDSWSAESLSSFKDCFSPDPKGVQVKYVYGSDFPYRDVQSHIAVTANDVGQVAPSLAIGGFSNVWGAAVLPFLGTDISDWPVTIDALKPHYEAVLRFMQIAGIQDELANLFPLYTDYIHELRRPPQALSIAARFEKNKESLRRSGFVFGAPRLAVRTGKTIAEPAQFSEPPVNDCIACGMCMYGCPYELIYSSMHTLRQLTRNRLCTHMPDVIIDKITEHDTGLTIAAHSRKDRRNLELSCERIFLGAGAIASTKILMESMQLQNEQITLKASEYFLLPMLSLLNAAEAREEGGQGLAQLFIECIDNSLCLHPAHLQLYTYSDLYYKAFANKLRFLGPLAHYAAITLAHRFCIIQGYLHSNESSEITGRLANGQLNLQGIPNKSARRKITDIAVRLLKLSKQTGFVPLLPLMQVGLPGDGRHIGGSFPMSAQPGKLQSDCLGRPFGFKNLHVVDATVFPSIPASTITFTAMANAHRIASEVLASI